MLDLIRKKQKSVFIKLAFAIIILSFIIGYAMLTSPGDGQNDQGGAAVIINDVTIGFDRYETVYGNISRLYRNVYREQFTPELEKQLGLRQQALDSIIEQELLVAESERLGARVTEQELVDSIAKIPSFQENGVFDKERYLKILAYQRMTPEDFETGQRRQLLAEKARDAIRDPVQVDNADIDEEYRRQNEKVNLAFARLTPALFEPQVKIDDKALRDFFAQKKDRFRLPETIALRYLLFEPDAYANDVVPTDEDLEKYYRRNLDKFDIPEQVRAAHILIKVAPDADPETKKLKRQLADQVLAEARSGKEFAALVHKYSDDQGTIARDGDLGFFNRGVMAAEFEKAAFVMKPGEISDIVTTSFGYHIIRCDGYREPGIKPLTEVRDAVKADVIIEKSRQSAFEKAMDAYNINRKTADLDSAAKAGKLEIKETGFFERDEPIEGLGEVPEVSSVAFALADRQLARPVNLPEGVLLFAIKERRPSRIPELAEVRADVERAYRRQQAVELARQTGVAMLAALAKGESLASQAEARHLTVEETGLFTRAQENFVPRLGEHEKLAKVAFELTAEKPTAPELQEIDGGFVVATLKERQGADPAKLDPAQRETLKTSVLSRKKDEAYQARIDALKAQAKATMFIAPALQELIEKEKK